MCNFFDFLELLTQPVIPILVKSCIALLINKAYNYSTMLDSLVFCTEHKDAGDHEGSEESDGNPMEDMSGKSIHVV